MSRTRLLVICLSCLLAATASVTAAERRTQPVPTHRFDIAGGPLDDALRHFQAITGRAVTAPPHATVDGLTTRGVSGVLSADAALTALLNGSGLTCRRVDAHTYALEVIVAGQSVEVTARAPYRPESTATATKTSALVRDVPQSITVVTREMIAEQRMQSMADVVRYVPGVGMGQGEGNRDTPILRGNSTTADFFVDGIRDDVQYFRDLYNVERVEALKGPNAMIFGRGGAGGVINRSTRQADWSTSREVSLLAGSHQNRRATVDFDQRLTGRLASRLTGVYENSGSFRREVSIERSGLNPTIAFTPGNRTIVRAGYEYFHDTRTADRGLPSFGNRPVAADRGTFFGDPAQSTARITVNALSSSVDHRFGSGVTLVNRTRLAHYDKFYQNVYPSAAAGAAGATVALAAYNNASGRWNAFNQTDVTLVANLLVGHRILTGAEFGRQATNNFRQTGYFSAGGPNATTMIVPVAAPTVSTPVTYRQSATDADNTAVGTVAAFYVQDELEFSRHLQAIVGLRYDRFSVDAHNRRSGADFASNDDLLSPRAGLVFKPVEALSLYSSYSMTYLPRAGESFSSLTLNNQALDPEQFRNYEIGAKWDVRRELSLTTAIYRLDRTNVVITDPNDANRSLLVDGQRTRGVEMGIAGNLTRSWTMFGGYAHQNGRITSNLSATARAGATLGQVPAHTFSLWNRYSLTPSVGAAVGVLHSSDQFTSTDNTVTLPASTRVDGAVFMTIARRFGLQVNVENLFDAQYYAFANGNNNITPGAPRSIRVSLTTRF